MTDYPAVLSNNIRMDDLQRVSLDMTDDIKNRGTSGLLGMAIFKESLKKPHKFKKGEKRKGERKWERKKGRRKGI